MKPRCLDLFCGAGGAGMGLHLAGFDVTGVDIAPQPRYPFAFHQADAMTFPLDGFDFVWASPPCQGYSRTARLNDARHPLLIEGVRARLIASGLAWTIENVPGSPLRYPVLLCGSMFGLGTYRHRMFETSVRLIPPYHPKHAKPNAKMGRPARDGEMMTVAGHFSDVRAARRAMGIEWMARDQLAQAIPPAYSRYIGEQMMPRVLAAMKGRAA